MFPSSSRVKLNRVALKNATELKSVPRRRRVPTSQSTVSGASQTQDTSHVSEPVPTKDTVPLRVSNEPIHTLLIHRTCPENVAADPPDGDPGEKAKGRDNMKPRRRTSCVDPELRPEKPCTGDIDRNSHPSPTGLAGSEACLRRAVGASACGGCKCVSPQQKTLCKQGENGTSPGIERPMVQVKTKKKTGVTKASQKIDIWTDQYPKVTLCDIGQTFAAFSQDCGYKLPHFLKTRVVHCFRKDMRAAFPFGPHCFGHNKHKSEKSAAAKKKKFCPKVELEKSGCQTHSLTEHQRHLKEGTDAPMLSSHTACRFLKSRTTEGSATCSPSLLLGKHVEIGERSTGMRDRDVVQEPETGSGIIGAEIHTGKRIKLRASGNNDVVPFTQGVEHVACKEPAKIDQRDKDSRLSSDQTAEGGRTSGSTLTESGVAEKSCAEQEQTAPELLCWRNEVDTDDLQSFTCQRVRVYFRKGRCSCARTYMPWPFAFVGHTAEPIDPDNSDSCTKRAEPGTGGTQTNDMLPRAPTGPRSDTAHQVSHQSYEKQGESGERVLTERNGKRRGRMSSYSADDTNMMPLLVEADQSVAGRHSDMATISSPSQAGRWPGFDAASSASLPVNRQTDGSVSTPPSTCVLSDWETATTLSNMSSPFTHDGLSSISVTPTSRLSSSFALRKVGSGESAEASSPSFMVKTVEKPLFHCEATQVASCSSSPSAPLLNHSFRESSLLPQEEPGSDEELTDRCPPTLHPYYASPFNCEGMLHKLLSEKFVKAEAMLPPMLSPISSPHKDSQTSFQSPGCSNEEEEEEMDKGISKLKALPGCHLPHVGIFKENAKDYVAHGAEELGAALVNFKPQASQREPQSLRSDEDVDDDNEVESRYESDCENNGEQSNKKCEGVSLDPKIKGAHNSPCSSTCSDEDDEGAVIDEQRPCSSEIEHSGGAPFNTEIAGDDEQSTLDEFTAYEQDILLVDVIQDDPELFENLPKESLLKLGPTRVMEAPKTSCIGGVKTLLPKRAATASGLEQRLTLVNAVILHDSSDTTEESNHRPWRPQCSRTPSKAQSNTCPATENQNKNMRQPDANNNYLNEGLERSQPSKMVNTLHNHIPPLMTRKKGPRITNPANVTELRRQNSNAYCRQYFSESLSCGFKMCRFQHVPVDGDEKFCVETVLQFTKNPMCLQKAGAVFTSYYQNNPPGVYFSMPVFLSLLWALLKAGRVSDVLSVLSISLAYKIVPGHEFVLALFNSVRERGLVSAVPELMQLTLKMASAGLVLSLDCLDCVKNSPEVQQTVSPNCDNHKLSAIAPCPEYMNLAQAVVEIELCAKQEHWRRMGEVFRSICQSSHHPNHVERISGRISIALLSESKDKLSLPFAAFSETVCQNEGEDSLVRSFLGRIGVSLMLRYHKTHQWAKGRRVVEVLSISKINYSRLKGLFGNEDQASCCCLVTVATELLLLSGSVEGALNTLRENKWFLSSSLWPCEPADLESRTRVLIRLAEKTSHRDSLEVLRNLPGLREPNALVNISSYCPLFNSHLKVCVDRQTLPVASDTVDFMLSKNLAVDQTVLSVLLHKLGQQNLWLRAREVFRHSLSVGYYPGVSAPLGFTTLIVPCHLGEVELALAFEMFITANATLILKLSEETCLSITLRRTQSCERDYLSAGSRLLSAAFIPQPKLIIQYKAVNSLQEQVFTLDLSSARCWLRHNHLWANEVWPH